MATTPDPPAPYKLVSEPMTGATFDNQSDPYFASIYSQIFPPYQDLAWARPNEISYSYQEPHLPNPYPMQIPIFSQPAAYPPPKIPVHFQEPLLPNPHTVHATIPIPNNYQPAAEIYATASRTYQNPPVQNQELLLPTLYTVNSSTTIPAASHINSRNHFLSPQTAASNTFNIPQTQDFESASWIIFELEHSIKILESMELSTIIIFLELINKKIGDIITSLQSSILATSLSKFEKKRITGLSYRIWDICIELTKQYPTGYDSCINEFGFFAVNLGELFKNSCITATKCVQADFACDNNQGLVSLDVHKPLIENTKGFLSSNLCEHDSSIPQISEDLIAKDNSFSHAGCLPVDQDTVVIQTAHEIVSLSEIKIVEEKVPFQSKVDTKAIFSCQASCKNGDIDLNIKESLGMVFQEATILETTLKGADEEKQTNKEVGKNATASNSCEAIYQPSTVVFKTGNMIIIRSSDANKGLSDYCLVLEVAKTTYINGDKRILFSFEDVITNGSSYKPPWPPPLLPLDLEDKVVLEEERRCNN